MQSRNGDVQLSVTLDTKGIKSDAQRIKQEIQKEVSDTRASVDTSEIKVKIDSTSIKDAQKNLESLKSETKNLETELNKTVETASSAGSETVQKAYEEQLVTLDDLKRRWENTLSNQDAFNAQTTDEGLVQFNNKLVEQQLQDIQNQVSWLTEEEQDAFDTWVDGLMDTRKSAQAVLETQQEAEEVQERVIADTEAYTQALKDAKVTASGLAQDLQAFSQGMMYSEEFRQYQEMSDILSKNLARINAKLKEMEVLGQADSEKYQEMVKQAEELAANLRDVNGLMDNMRNEGDAYTIGSNPQEAAQVQKQYDVITDKMSLMKAKLSDINQLASLLPGRLGTSFNKISRAIQSMTKMSGAAVESTTAGMAGTASAAGASIAATATAVGAAITVIVTITKMYIKYIKKALEELKKAFSLVSNALIKSLKVGLQGLVTSAQILWGTFFKFGKFLTGTLLTGVQTLISKLMSLKSVVSENLKIMAKWHNGNNAVNKALSNLTSSLAYLKASLATAFAPILTVVEPMLTRLIDKLAEVITMIGMFIAKLTGATSFQKAIKKQKDYAKSLSGVGSAAGEANKKLAEYDKLQVIDSDKGGGGAGVDFETAELEDFSLEALDLSKLLDELIKKAGEWGNKLGTGLRDFLNSIDWDFIQECINKVAKAIANFINEFIRVEGLGTAIGHAFGELVNTIVGFVDTLITEIDWGALGKFLGDIIMEAIETIEWDKIGQMLADGFNALFTFIRAFFARFNGLEFGQKLSEMLTNFTQGIDWETVRRAINNMMRDFTGILNGFVTPETFGEIGRTLGETIQTLFSGLGTFVETAEWVQWGQSIGTAIVNAFNSVDWAEAGKAVSDFATELLDMLMAALDTALAEDEEGNIPLVDNIITFLDNIDWSAITSKMKEISEKLRGVFELLWQKLQESGVLQEVIDMVVVVLTEKKNWEKMFQRMKNVFSITTLLKYMFPKTFSLGDTFVNLFESIKKDLQEKDWASLGQDILAGILNVFLVPLTFINEAVSFFFTSLWDSLCSKFDINSPSKEMEPIGENIIKGILEGFSLVDFAASMSAWWDENIAPWFTLERWTEIAQNVFNALSTKFTEVKTMLSTKLTEIKTDVSEKWEEIKLGISEKVDLIKTSITEKFTALKTSVGYIFTLMKNKIVEIFTALKTALATPINAILGAVEAMVNGIIAGINKMIDALNGVGFDVPDWLPAVGGKNFSLNLTKLSEIQLPRLAQGAVIPPNKEFMAVLGDQKSGTNIETPLNTMMDAFRQVMNEYNGSVNKEPIVLQLNGKTVAQVVWDEERKKYRQTASYSY